MRHAQSASDLLRAGEPNTGDGIATRWSVARESVAKLLASFPELKEFRLESLGYGARRPVATNDTESGRRRNRRVELLLVAR